ncbi:MAG: hypothetical protein WB821_14880 [Burkholderiaceae bacterium]
MTLQQKLLGGVTQRFNTSALHPKERSQSGFGDFINRMFKPLAGHQQQTFIPS